MGCDMIKQKTNVVTYVEMLKNHSLNEYFDKEEKILEE